MDERDGNKGKAFPSLRPSGYSRREALGMLGVGSAATLSGYAVNAAPAQAAPAPTRSPKRGGVLKLGHRSDVYGFDPTALPEGNYQMVFSIYDTLLTMDEKYQLTPQLAESWEMLDGGKRIHMKLRKGVIFHSGREFTADDVVFSLKRTQDPEVAANIMLQAQIVKEAKADGKYDIDFRLDKPYSAIMEMFDNLFIMDRESVATIKTKGVGTGPFVLKAWLPNTKVILERNPNYWKGGQPYLDGVELIVIPDAATLAINMESAAIDMAHGLSPTDLRRLQPNKDLEVILSGYGADYNDVLMNVTRPPFDNSKVRAAIAAAIDRDRFAKNFYAGFSEPVCLPFRPGSLAYFEDQAKRWEYNLDKAKVLLREAGASAANVSVLVSSQGYWMGSDTLGQIMQADLKTIGFNVRIDDQPQAQARPRWQKSDFQLCNHTFAKASKDPLTLFTSARVWVANCKTNVTQFCSEKYTKLLNEASATLDADKRRQIFREINEIILAENFCLTIAPGFRGYVHHKRVQGAQFNLDGYAILGSTWFA